MKLLLLSTLFAVALSGDVVQLTDSNFDSKVAAEPLSLVKFYAPWCGHCKKIAPEFEKAATTLKANDPPVALFEIDCTDNQKSCGAHGVSGYPTLKVFRNGEPSDYSGGRTAADMVKSMAGQAGDASTEIKDMAKWKSVSALKVPVVVGFFEKAADAKSFKSAAEELRETVRFSHTFSAEIAEAAGYAMGDIVLFRPAAMKNKFEESTVKYAKDKKTVGLIRSFATDNFRGSCPVVEPADRDGLGFPQIVAMYNVDYERDPKGTQYWRNRVMKVAGGFADKGWKFAVGSASAWQGFLQDVGANFEKSPIVAIFSDKDTKYLMQEEFTMDSFTAYLEKFDAGELVPHLKTEGDIDNTNNANKILTATNFKKEVDGSKDALVYFYAPWCGHCKSLAPKWEAAAEEVKDNDNVIMGKFDATANDVPSGFEVQGFPTIYWIPAGKAPEKYTSGRETADLTKWIKDKASKKKDEL